MPHTVYCSSHHHHCCHQSQSESVKQWSNDMQSWLMITTHHLWCRLEVC